MFNALLITATIVAVLSAILMGVMFGYYAKEIRTSISALRSRVANLEEGGGMPDPAIIDAKTPKQVNEELFDEPDEESAIVTAKKPGELRREQDRKLQEDLDRLGR